MAAEKGKNKRKRKSSNKAKSGSRTKFAEASDHHVMASLEPRTVCGIPEGVKDEEYIKYRTCKYIEDINAVRRCWTKSLSTGMVNKKDL